MKLTPWFSGDQKPVRVGVYRRNIFGKGIASYSYWNGKFWGLYSPMPDVASSLSWKNFRSKVQNLPWRGVMK
jgi:hypothetical protein